MESKRVDENSSRTDQNGNAEDSEYIYKDEYYAPEGSQGWIIVVAAFLSILIAEGITGSFATIFKRNDEDEFSANHNETSTDVMLLHQRNIIETTLILVTGLAGPLASGLAEKFGFRPVSILGSLLATIGIFLSWAISPEEPNFYSFLVGFGIFAGFGLGTMFTLPVGVVGLFFDKNRALATGIIMMGPNIGTLLLHPATQLFSELGLGGGWQGALWFQGGLCAISILLALAYAPRPKRTVKVLKSEMESSEENIPVLVQIKKLFTSPSFVILCMAGNFVLNGSLTLMNFTIFRGFDILRAEEAVNLLTALGAANLAARIGFGILVNKVGSSLLIWNVTLTLGAFVHGAHLVSNEFWVMITCAVVVGMCFGMHASLRPILIMDIAKDKMFNMAQGISLFFTFFGGTILAIVEAKLKANSEYLETPLFVGGGFLILAALMCCTLPHIQAWEERRKCANVISRVSTNPSSTSSERAACQA